jgi:predicted ATPase/DNA-binding SARP family transcriptional activator
VGASPPGYALVVSPDQLDVHRFEELVQQGQRALVRGAPGLASDRLHAALALWRGPALADVAEGGTLALEARRLDELRLVCIEDRIEADLALGHHAELVPELERLVGEEPLRERLWRELMLALYRSERQSDALAAYSRARKLLDEELGLEPSEELRALERDVLRHDIAAVPPAEERHNLPAQTASFVGREDELAELETLLRDQRLVTLTGVGGAGKTRLALAVAARQTGAWPGGVWLVDLTPLSDSTFVVSTVATTLAVGELDIPARESLLTHIGGSELLLVLDNCEHLVTACSELAEALLSGCPNLRLLATSRMPLGTVGEHEYRVDPLPTPGEAASVAEIEHAPSVQLFLERGRAVRRDLVATGDGLATVAKICRELDGLPLAIELAAARASVLSLSEIAERLSDRFRFLRAWRRVADPRHQTLQATMDWSYRLLSDDERELLRGLSVFASGSTLEAVAFVCSDGDQERALELVSRLVEASVVVAEDSSGVTRYRLLETIRQYAAEQLAAADTDERGSGDRLRRRHAEFFALLAERAEPRLDSADVLVQLAADEGNFRSALAFSADGREPELMLRIAGSLCLFWDPREQLEEARDWLEAAIQHGAGSRARFRARALRGLAGTHDSLGDPAAARKRLDEALDLYRELEDDDGVGRCLNNLGNILFSDGDLDGATALYRQAMALEDERAAIVPRRNLAEVALRRGDLTERRRLCEDVLVDARALQHDRAVSGILVELAWVAAVEGRYEDAARLAGEALGLHLQMGLPGEVTECVLIAALIHAGRGYRDDAARLVGAATAHGVQRGWQELPEAIFKPPFEALERALGEERYAAMCAEGAALSFDVAVELAARALA